MLSHESLGLGTNTKDIVVFGVGRFAGLHSKDMCWWKVNFLKYKKNKNFHLRARAHAAPTGFNAIDVGGGAVKDFLKIPGGYRDGFQKVIFEEVGPTNVAVSPDLPLNDRFGAYDDTNVVSDNNGL